MDLHSHLLVGEAKKENGMDKEGICLNAWDDR